MSKQALALFSIYNHPRDYPDNVVVRRHWATIPASCDPEPFVVADSLEEARRSLPPGLHNLGRDPRDDPAIVETWI